MVNLLSGVIAVDKYENEVARHKLLKYELSNLPLCDK